MNATLPLIHDSLSPEDPWFEARARFGLSSVVRVIDLANGSDTFRLLAASRDALKDDSDLLIDGTTLILGLTEEPTHEERLAIIHRFDEAWRTRRAAREPHRRRYR